MLNSVGGHILRVVWVAGSWLGWLSVHLCTDLGVLDVVGLCCKAEAVVEKRGEVEDEEIIWCLWRRGGLRGYGEACLAWD